MFVAGAWRRSWADKRLISSNRCGFCVVGMASGASGAKLECSQLRFDVVGMLFGVSGA